MLNRRYDDLKSGKVKPVDGEAFFESLRKREDDLLNQQWPLGWVLAFYVAGVLFRPVPGLRCRAGFPMAYAMGYYLPPYGLSADW